MPSRRLRRTRSSAFRANAGQSPAPVKIATTAASTTQTGTTRPIKKLKLDRSRSASRLVVQLDDSDHDRSSQDGDDDDRLTTTTEDDEGNQENRDPTTYNYLTTPQRPRLRARLGKSNLRTKRLANNQTLATNEGRGRTGATTSKSGFHEVKKIGRTARGRMSQTPQDNTPKGRSVINNAHGHRSSLKKRKRDGNNRQLVPGNIGRANDFSSEEFTDEVDSDDDDGEDNSSRMDVSVASSTVKPSEENVDGDDDGDSDEPEFIGEGES